ncbi:MAG: ABC transporter permease [Actinobacteria bacterium]|nr:ABC transporter permease [Actinomycetota bacterium]
MNGPNLVFEVAYRELRTHARTTAFKAITAFLVAAAIVGPVVVALWPDEDGARQVSIGLADGADRSLEETIVALAQGGLDVEFVPLSGRSQADTEAALASGDIDVIVDAPDTLVWDSQVDAPLAAILGAALQQRALLVRGEAYDLSENDVRQLLTPVDIADRIVDMTESSDFILAIAALGLFAGFLIPQVFGQLTLVSVVEEKSTGVVEVLLGHIHPRTLLLGKVLGLTLLAIGQILVFLAGLGAAMFATDSIDVSGSVWSFVPVLAVSLIGGLVFFNTLFALLGSLISRQEDASQVILPVVAPLMVGFIVGQLAIGGRADTTIIRVLTFVPPITPMLLPIRVARDAVAPWEVAAALSLLVLASWAMIRAAARVYEFTLLHSGSRVSWKKAWGFVRARPGSE